MVQGDRRKWLIVNGELLMEEPAPFILLFSCLLALPTNQRAAHDK